MDSSQHYLTSELFTHLKSTTSTPPPSSSNITAWVDQLPTPPQPYLRSATSRSLAAISANLQRPLPDHHPKASAADQSLKRRARSPLPLHRPSKRTLAAFSEPTKAQRRSVRLASQQSKMNTPNRGNRRTRATESPPSDYGDVEEEEEEEQAGTGHPIATRRRTVAMHGAPSTPDRPIAGSLYGAPMPRLPPTTPSGKSASPAKSARKSPSKSPSKPRTASPSKSNSTSSSSRVIIHKNQLAQMSPSTSFEGIGLVKNDACPKAAKVFWNKYIKSVLHEDEIVPKELRAQLEEEFNTPMKTKGPISKYTYAAKLYDAVDMSKVLETVVDVVEQACKQRDSHEPQWVSKVVTPIMSRVQKLKSSVSAKGRHIDDLNISSVSIAPLSLCPTSIVDGFKDANKKVDYALALELTHEERITLQSDVTEYRVPGGASINQTQGWTAFKPMFTCTEVKVDGDDPMIQLAVWVSAEVEKRRQEGYATDLPFPAIAVDGDHWDLWIAYSADIDAKKGGKGYRVQFLGPIAMGNTCNAFGVFKILHVLKAIVRWGLEVYDPHFKANVLARFE
ncbi:MAG: hypothetical protein LQ341_006546 [Variospora aurantia]|nr:MAG: hypothetical protein LQ341_006546 [Variospora aurantia]